MPRSMAAALDGWGDLTGQKKKNADHNARESQLGREEEERGFTRRSPQAAKFTASSSLCSNSTRTGIE